MVSEANAELPDEETSEAQEPSNLELKEMLVDIKIELSNIARENNKFAKEIEELRNPIQEQKIELDGLKTSIKNIGTQGVQELFFCDLKAPGGCSTRWTHKGNSFMCTGVPDSSQCHYKV